VEQKCTGTTAGPSTKEDKDAAPGTTAGLSGTTARKDFLLQIQVNTGKEQAGTTAPQDGTTARGAVTATFAPRL
jgi:hypothetical protein